MAKDKKCFMCENTMVVLCDGVKENMEICSVPMCVEHSKLIGEDTHVCELHSTKEEIERTLKYRNKQVLREKQIYEIPLTDAIRIYKESEEFRNMTSDGMFIYCEDVFVLRLPKYVTFKKGKQQLTDYARNNKSECCLAFAVNAYFADENK